MDIYFLLFINVLYSMCEVPATHSLSFFCSEIAAHHKGKWRHWRNNIYQLQEFHNTLKVSCPRVSPSPGTTRGWSSGRCAGPLPQEPAQQPPFLLWNEEGDGHTCSVDTGGSAENRNLANLLPLKNLYWDAGVGFGLKQVSLVEGKMCWYFLSTWSGSHLPH